VRPYRLHTAGIFLLSLLQSPLALLTPLPLKIAVDSMVGSHHLPSFLALLLPASATLSHTAVLILTAGLFVAVALLSQLQQLGSSVLSTYTGERLVQNFRTQLFRHVHRLSLAHHDTQGTADSTYRIQYDAMAIQTIAIDGIIPLIGAALTLAGMIYVTALIDGQLALVVLAVSPVLVLISRGYKRRLRSKSRAVKRLESSALAVVQEVLAAVRVVKAFGQEERMLRELKAFDAHAEELSRCRHGAGTGQGSTAWGSRVRDPACPRRAADRARWIYTCTYSHPIPLTRHLDTFDACRGSRVTP
jgi:ATP-binding cassette, subfamily B, bacterial